MPFSVPSALPSVRPRRRMDLLTALTGPTGLAIAASVAVAALWRIHVKGDEQKDATIKVLTEAVNAFPAALKDLTAVVVDTAEREKARTRNERVGDP